jgi:hypothetical protein
MFKAIITGFLVVNAAQVAFASNSSNCTMSTGFEKEKCGDGDTATCCGSREYCVGPVKPKTGNDMYACSTERQLSGTKVIKVVLVPVYFLLMDIFFVGFMVLKLDIKQNHVTKLCVGVIALSWPLLLSAYWSFGVYAAFLALFVAFMGTSNGFPWWVYRGAWVMQVFQVVLLFGPNETFHVPLFNQSHASESTNLVSKFLDFSEMACSTYYENYFKLLDIEKMAEDADPDTQFNGYCQIGWLGVVQGTLFLQAIVWMVMVLFSAPVFLTDTDRSIKGKEGANVVQVKPAAYEDQVTPFKDA